MNVVAFVLQLLGAVAVSVGLCLFSPWVGVTTLGVLLMAFGVAVELRGGS